ncbi:MAG: WD40 repeat domain-containing protein [Bacteroidetes bacterium]|nr:WD40 repeat domain-containing protein [Bacteroidota bacterium]
MKRILSLALFLTFTIPGKAQIDPNRSFKLGAPIRGMSNYGWKLFLMTDDGLYYWGKKVPEMGKGAYVCSPLGNSFFLATEKGDLIQYNTNDFEKQDDFNISLKDEKFTRIFFEGKGQEMYGITSLGRLIRIYPGKGKETLKPVQKGFNGLKIAWNPNLNTFLTSRAKQLQYARLDGKPATTTLNLDRSVTAIQVEPAKYEILAGLDNGKVAVIDQGLTQKKNTLNIGVASITSLAYHPVDHYLFAGDITGKLHVYDLRKKKIIFSKKIHASSVDIRILRNANGKINLVTIGNDAEIKSWSVDKLAPDYNRIVNEKLAASEVTYIKKDSKESQQDYQNRTSQENLSKFLSDRKQDLIDSLASTLRVQGNPNLMVKGDSLTLDVKPFKPVTFYAAAGSVTLATMDSLRFMLHEDNDFSPRRFNLTFTNGKKLRYDSNAPMAVKKTEVPLELAREIAQEEQTLRDELAVLVANMKKRGELNNVELSMESSLKTEKDSLGRDELNLHVTFMYRGTKGEGSGASADYPSGKFKLSDSRAASTLVDFMLRTAKEQLWKHMNNETRVTFRLTGSTDKMKVSSKIPYNNEFGPFREYPYYFQGDLAGLNVDPTTGITENSQLGFLRTYGVRDYLEKVKSSFSTTKNKYEHYSEEGDGIGPEFRKVKIEVILHDINKKNAGG